MIKRKKHSSSFLFATLLVVFCMTLGSFAHAEPQKYVFDASHTAITWHIDHFGFSKPSGKFMNVDGVVMLDETAPENSKVEVSIPIDLVNTGVPALDDHLKTADFFDTQTHPIARFVSHTVERISDKEAKVHGDLTLHGVTKPVTLNVTLNRLAENMFKKQTAGFAATTTIKRSDFGITKYLPNLGDDIKIEIQAEANLQES